MMYRGRSVKKQNTRARCRRGATLVELAIVLPVSFFLIGALIVGVLGVFRFQEVAALSRAASRYASTHGAHYREAAGLGKGTAADWQADIQTNVIQPAMVLLDPKLLTVQANWPDVINQPGTPDNWPKSTVTITISYQWFPELFLVGSFRMCSTSSVEIAN